VCLCSSCGGCVFVLFFLRAVFGLFPLRLLRLSGAGW
jgi:hypothetical protein